MAKASVTDRYKGFDHEFGQVQHTYASRRNQTEDSEEITALLARVNLEGGWTPISIVPFSSLAGSWTVIYVKRPIVT